MRVCQRVHGTRRALPLHACMHGALHIHLHILQLQLASKHAANLPCLSRAVNYFLLSLTGRINDDSHRILILGVRIRAFFFLFSFLLRKSVSVPTSPFHSSSIIHLLGPNARPTIPQRQGLAGSCCSTTTRPCICAEQRGLCCWLAISSCFRLGWWGTTDK